MGEREQEHPASQKGCSRMKTGYTITTRYSLDGTIEQTVHAEHTSGAREMVQKHVINTMEAQTRRALMKLGWRPPAEKSRR